MKLPSTRSVQLKWIAEPGDVEVPVGKSLMIPCAAGGGGSPTVSWSRLDEGRSSSFYGPELRFNPVKQDDAGYYECRASNGVDKDLVSRIKLNVLGKYRGFFGQPSPSKKLHVIKSKDKIGIINQPSNVYYSVLNILELSELDHGKQTVSLEI